MNAVSFSQDYDFFSIQFHNTPIIRSEDSKQEAVGSKKSIPPPCFFDLSFDYCILLTAICLLVSLCASNLIPNAIGSGYAPI